MSWRRCPDQAALLEIVSIPGEVSFFRKARVRLHTMRCEACDARVESLKATWQAYITPEPDVTSSLLRVYSKLQKDETLILKGWKLNEVQPARDLNYWLYQRGWLFRGGLSFAGITIAVIVGLAQFSTSGRQDTVAQESARARAPLAQFRMEDRNTVQVRYVQPELLESMEFETTSAAR
jgi:hypothetical protein